MNKKVFILLLIIVAVLLISGCVKKVREKPSEPAPATVPASTPSNGEDGQTPSVSTSTPTDNQALYDKYESECFKKGWQKTTTNVDGMPRKILWKGPKQAWKNGAIIALHGGGGTYSNFCANIDLGKPMIEFRV